ncbi:MAG: SDR family NAD(P)-dependent oxidoreductase [Gammaproteobacteria bacterium]|nr:SDR family NAD(P)-dependent oxidoreductase [Gammaproteobacteria bacterium]
MPKLVDRVAIVTGAGRGVGYATALMLAKEGASIVVNDLDAAEAEATVAAIKGGDGNAIACAGDITADDYPETLIQTALDGYGGIDIIVNNAGYIWNGAMHNHTDEQWQAMLDVHVTAPFRILRAFAPWMRQQAKREIEQDGRARCRKVVNVSSVSGTTGAATQVAYSAGKAGVVGLTKTLAKEWGRYNVTVNCVAFGHIRTRLTQPYEGEPPRIDVAGRDYKVGLTDAQIRAVQATAALGRSGEPQDGAGAILLFCFPESDYVTGEVLTCAGGI